MFYFYFRAKVPKTMVKGTIKRAKKQKFFCFFRARVPKTIVKGTIKREKNKIKPILFLLPSRRSIGRRPRGRGWIKLSAHSCRNEVCDHSSASVKHKENKTLRSLRTLREKQNALIFYLTQRTQRTQNFQSKLRCRWSSRWLRATENAKANRNGYGYYPPPPLNERKTEM